jgi:hypothetical protein
MPMVSSKDFSIMSKLEQIFATSLRKERAMWERWEKEEKFGYSNNTLRIHHENEGGEPFIYTWEGKVTPFGCFPSVNT